MHITALMGGFSFGALHMALTPKQEAFALAYVETGNASEAYRRAYSAERMKPETVN
ncbi:terminase small subunit, partial [Bordetella avium]